MAPSINARAASDPVGNLDRIRPAAAKADLRSDAVGPASDLVGPSFARTMAEAVVQHYGSVKAAAISLGDVDPSLMQREFREGKFERFDRYADDETKAYVAEELKKTYPDGDPKARLRRELREIRSRCDRIEELLT